MRYEVEQKFAAPEDDRIEPRLRELGAEFLEDLQQSDEYFAHPQRNFAETDEALRVRQVGEHCFYTYKGPREDRETKTRRELEFAVADGNQAAQLLRLLGFTSVAVVRKRRRRAALAWQGWAVEVALDDVEGVGRYVELEVLSGSERLSAAKQVVQDLADYLQLAQPERRSYLELLLEGTGER